MDPSNFVSDSYARSLDDHVTVSGRMPDSDAVLCFERFLNEDFEIVPDDTFFDAPGRVIDRPFSAMGKMFRGLQACGAIRHGRQKQPFAFSQGWFGLKMLIVPQTRWKIKLKSLRPLHRYTFYRRVGEEFLAHKTRVYHFPKRQADVACQTPVSWRRTCFHRIKKKKFTMEQLSLAARRSSSYLDVIASLSGRGKRD